VLYQWESAGWSGYRDIASQGAHLIMLEEQAIRRFPKDGTSQSLIATPADGNRFLGLVEDGGYVYFAETNSSTSLEPPFHTEIHRVAGDGMTVDVLVDTLAPIHRLSVSGNEAFVSYCATSPTVCYLDLVDLETGTKTETALPLPQHGRLAVSANYVDYLSATGNQAVLVRLHRTTGELASVSQYASSALAPSVHGPFLVGETGYFSAGIVDENYTIRYRTFAYPIVDPAAATSLSDEPEGQPWIAQAEVVAGDADEIYFHGYFSALVDGESRGDGWSGTATFDPENREFSRFIDLGPFFFERRALAVDATHVYVVATQNNEHRIVRVSR
jgi:hypothetical protein